MSSFMVFGPIGIDCQFPEGCLPAKQLCLLYLSRGVHWPIEQLSLQVALSYWKALHFPGSLLNSLRAATGKHFWVLLSLQRVTSSLAADRV